jgi:putative peptidoglycan lipid II flippase
MDAADPGSTAAEARGDHVVRRQRGVGRRTVWISLLTLLSRLFGMVREVGSAWLFGDSSAVYDAFLFAWRIPNLFRRFLGEGALATSLQKSLTEVDATRGEEAGAALFGATLSLLARLLTVLCAVVMAAVWLMPDTLPGTDFRWLGPDPDAVRELTLRVTPFVLLVCLTAAAGGALNVRGHYSLPAIGPVVLNLVWIGTLVVLASSVGFEVPDPGSHLELARLLTWGVLAAGALQLVVLVPALRRTALLVGGVSRTGEARAAARDVLRRSAPLALGAAVYQVNVMIDGMMAQGLLPTGGQTVHYLANRVQQFPLALVAVAATTAVFPALAALGQQRRLEELRSLHDETQRNVLFVALPAACGLAALATPIAAALFEGGGFGAAGVERTGDALRVLAFAILPAGAVGLVARTYYSLGDFHTPVRISSWMLALNAVLNVLFIQGLGMDADGLALATGLTSLGNLLLLLPGLHGRLGLPLARPGLPASLGRMALAGLVCGGVAAALEGFLVGSLGRWGALGAAMFAGGLAYACAARLLGVPEWQNFASRFQRIRAKLTGR